MNTITDMKKQPFTQLETDFLKENFVRFGTKYCAEKLERNFPYVAKKAYALGLKRRDSSQWKIDKSPQQVNMKQFYNITDPGIAYILGFIWADGHITKKKNGVVIAIHNNDGADLKKIFLKHIPFKIHITKRNKQYMFHLYDFYLHQFLVDNDYLIKSVASPSKILSYIPSHLHHYFFRGYFDGDGCFTNKSNCCISYNGSYEQDWSDITKMIEEIIGYKPVVIRRIWKTSKSSFVYVYGKSKVKRILSYLYRGEKVGLKRKANPSYKFITSP